MRAAVLVPLLTGVLLGGCAEMNSIYRRGALPKASDGGVYTVDAKQRHLVVVPDNNNNPQWRMCAEAAPDVFSAYATSVSAKGGVKDRDVSADLSISNAETAATIERTQTINMLRESMYRTCERYLSGATGKATFITQAARDQRSMIAILAIEQLTRAARPPSTIISGPPTGASIKDGEAAAKLVEEFRKEATASAATLAATRAQLDAAAAMNDCKANDKAVIKDGASDDDKAKATADFAECMKLKTLEATQAAADKAAQERLDQALKLAAEMVTSINAATQAGASNAGAGGGKLDPQTAAVLGEAVFKIARDASIDESLMFCVAYLSEPKVATEVESAIQGARADADKARLGANAQATAADAKADAKTVPMSTVEMCNTIIMMRATLDNQRLLVDARNVISYHPGPATDALEQFLKSGTAEETARLGQVREALKSLGSANDAAAVVRLTTGQNESLQQAVLAVLRARHPEAFK